MLYIGFAAVYNIIVDDRTSTDVTLYAIIIIAVTSTTRSSYPT